MDKVKTVIVWAISMAVAGLISYGLGINNTKKTDTDAYMSACVVTVPNLTQAKCKQQWNDAQYRVQQKGK